MILDFQDDSILKIDLPPGQSAEDIAKRAIEASLREVLCPYEAEVSLLITDSARIREINRCFRNIDSATDVLSFPYQEFSAPGDFSDMDKNSCDVFDSQTGALMLGDIVINSERVMSQAIEYGHSPIREYAFLIVHSMLHLTGFDHIRMRERYLMEEYQRRIMEVIQIER